MKIIARLAPPLTALKVVDKMKPKKRRNKAPGR